jgi:hypothetical protein
LGVDAEPFEFNDVLERFLCSENDLGGEVFVDDATDAADAVEAERRFGWDEWRCRWEGRERCGSRRGGLVREPSLA